MKLTNRTGRLAVTSALFFAALRLVGAPNPTQDIPDQLDINTALRFALENNFSIRQAQERIKQQEGVLVEVRSRDIPNVSVNYQYQKYDDHRLEVTQRGVSDQNWSVNIQAVQNIYAGGGNHASIEGQKLVRDAAILEMKGIVNEALFQVRQAFNVVLLDQKKISVQEDSLHLAEETLKTIQNRYDSGTVSKFDLLRAQVSVANARPPLIGARNDFRIAIEQLRQLLGFATRTAPNLTKTPKFVGELEYEPIQLDLIAAMEAARSNRPEIERFSKLSQAREQGITVQKSGYLPRLDAVAGYEWAKSSFTNDLFNHTLHGWVLGVQGSWAVFDGFATRGRVAQAKSLLEQAKLASAEEELAIDVEVRTAFSSWQEADELVNASKATVQQAEESVRLSQARFDAGSATQLDILQARVDLTQARTNEIQAYYTYTVSVAALRRAMGQSANFVEGASAAK